MFGLGTNEFKELKRSHCAQKVLSKGKHGFRRFKQAGSYHIPAQESSNVFLYAVASSWDMRKNFLPNTIYPNTLYVLLFQMAL